MTLQGVFFILYHLTGFNIFSVEIYLEEYFGGGLVYRYYKAMPLFNYINYSLSLALLLSSKKGIWIFPLSIGVICEILTATRSAFIVLVLTILIIFILFTRFKITRFIQYTLLFIALIVLLFAWISHFLPHQLNYLQYRLSEIQSSGSVAKVGNFAFRLSLIGQSFQDVSGGDLLIGKGYKRVAKVGDYDYVLGGDTHIPGIIYTEGVLGFTLRLIPFLLLLVTSWRSYLKTKMPVDIIIITLIISALFNIIQTPLFRDYTFMYPILILLYLLENNKEDFIYNR